MEATKPSSNVCQETPEKSPVRTHGKPTLGPLSPITPFPKHPLVQAAKVGIREQISELLDDKSLEKSHDQLGWALMCAVQFGRRDATKALILAGAPLVAKMQFNDGKKYHTVMMACKYGHPECLEIVLDIGGLDNFLDRLTRLNLFPFPSTLNSSSPLTHLI